MLANCKQNHRGSGPYVHAAIHNTVVTTARSYQVSNLSNLQLEMKLKPCWQAADGCSRLLDGLVGHLTTAVRGANFASSSGSGSAPTSEVDALVKVLLKQAIAALQQRQSLLHQRDFPPTVPRVH